MTMKPGLAISASITSFIALIQLCWAPPAVLGPIIIAADGAIGGSAIAAGINHPPLRVSTEKRVDGVQGWPVSGTRP